RTHVRANSVLMESDFALATKIRIFCGEPVPTSPENALANLGCRFTASFSSAVALAAANRFAGQCIDSAAHDTPTLIFRGRPEKDICARIDALKTRTQWTSDSRLGKRTLANAERDGPPGRSRSGCAHGSAHPGLVSPAAPLRARASECA